MSGRELRRATFKATELVAMICPGCLARAKRKRAPDGSFVGLCDGTFHCANCGWSGPDSALRREAAEH
jgi:hypothetical protein